MSASHSESMIPARVREVLRCIVPWISDAKGSKYRINYKGVRGRIGIVGGARDYAGAPYFASISTMRLGADLAYVICSQGASLSIKNYSPDLIVTPMLDCQDEREFSSEIECLLARLHALVIGPGLGREKLLQTRARKLIEEAKARSIPLVLDADSLILVNEDPSIIKSYPKAILTPNRIELQRLLNSIYAPKDFDLRNMTSQEIEGLVKQCARDLEVTILAKGVVDIICDTDFMLLTDDNSGSDRRCGGQGDILSGLAGVYLHWIMESNKQSTESPIEHPVAWAAYLAAITTRRCNELAFKEFKQGMVASNMTDKVQEALDSLLNDSHESSNIGNSEIRGLEYSGKLNSEEIRRYARHMIMDEFGPVHQLKLKNASAIIIGAGGLGCPSAVYLGANGIGRLGIVDDDKVESSNLHRQILHNVHKLGMLKTDSIKEAVLAINPNVEVFTHPVRLTRHNAVELIEKYDIVIDASDNLLTRYLISDACVVAKKPLVSGAALKMDGQLTVYNYDENTPCFRCLFPVPPPPNAVGSCSDNGVLGVIPGVIGVQQALEALKIASGLQPAYAGKMLLFDGQLGLFRQVTLGKRKPNCEACGQNSTLDRTLIDYEQFCGQNKCETQQSSATNILEPDERISVEEYRDIIDKGISHVLVDVRPLAHSDISRFAHALQIPLADLIQNSEESYAKISELLKTKNTHTIYVVCRRGIASQRGAKALQAIFEKRNTNVIVKDIVGGMTKWAAKVDSDYACV